jgi:hypothetical protein
MPSAFIAIGWAPWPDIPANRSASVLDLSPVIRPKADALYWTPAPDFGRCGELAFMYAARLTKVIPGAFIALGWTAPSQRARVGFGPITPPRLTRSLAGPCGRPNTKKAGGDRPLAC